MSLSLALIGAVCSYATCDAAAYQLFEQNVAHLGVAHANDSAGLPDASMGYYNPAAMVGLSQSEWIVGINHVKTGVRFKGCTSMSTITPFPYRQCGQAQGGMHSTIPYVHIATPYNWLSYFVAQAPNATLPEKKLWFSFHITTPFGLGTEFPDDAITQYIATKTQIQTLNIGPSLAFRVTSWLAWGIGLDRQYLVADFNNRAGALLPGFLDSDETNHLHSWAWGWHTGLLFQLDAQTRLGLSVHSQVTHHARGTSQLTGPLASINLVPNAVFTSQGLRTRFILPKTVRLGLHHRFNARLTGMMDAAFTDWHAVTEIVSHGVAGLDPVDSNLPPAIITVRVRQNLKDTWRVAWGAQYQANAHWQLRAGLALDQTPTRPSTRNVLMPGSDRRQGTLGLGYQSQHWRLDVAWSHYWLARAAIHVRQVVGPEITGTQGQVDAQADVFGLQLSWQL